MSQYSEGTFCYSAMQFRNPLISVLSSSSLIPAALLPCPDLRARSTVVAVITDYAGSVAAVAAIGLAYLECMTKGPAAE